MSHDKKILALTKYGLLAASARQRFKAYEPYLDRYGFKLEIAPLLDDDYLAPRLKNGRQSFLPVARGYLSRVRKLSSQKGISALWVHCEAFPYLPGFAERLAGIHRKPIVFDFDDAIFHNYDQHKNKIIRRVLGKKLVPLVKQAHLSMCGNAYLEAWVKLHSDRTKIVPTVVDIETYIPSDFAKRTEISCIGWIGSPSTWNYVVPILQLLKDVCQNECAAALIVGSGQLQEQVNGFNYHDWSEATEVAAIQSMDIGIMPLTDSPWARGKCGYKLIQYMACGLPVVASPVGVNADIVEHGVNGFLASTKQEWHEALTTLLRDPALRQRMGAAGRKKVESDYSLQVWGPRVAEMFQGVMEARR